MASLCEALQLVLHLPNSPESPHHFISQKWLDFWVGRLWSHDVEQSNLTGGCAQKSTFGLRCADAKQVLSGRIFGQLVFMFRGWNSESWLKRLAGVCFTQTCICFVRYRLHDPETLARQLYILSVRHGLVVRACVAWCGNIPRWVWTLPTHVNSNTHRLFWVLD